MSSEAKEPVKKIELLSSNKGIPKDPETGVKTEASEKEENPQQIAEEKYKRKYGLNKRVMTALLAFMGVMTVVIALISTYLIVRVYYKQYSSKGQDLVRMLAHQIDGDWLREYSNSYVEDENYHNVKKLLDMLKNDFTGLQYLYIYKPEDTYFTYLIEGQSSTDDPDVIAGAGDVYEYLEYDYKHLVPDIREQKASDELILGQDAGYGRPIAAWAPIFDSNGEMVAMVEADYIIEDIGRKIATPVALIIIVQILCILCGVSMIIVYLRHNVVMPIVGLTRTVDSYEHGEYKGDLSGFRHDDEIRSLAVSFRDMTARIDDYISKITSITAEKERISAELNVATQIQADMLPRIFPAFPDRKEFDLFASMDPAKEVGGDFYDFFMIDENKLGLVIADVSGKGIPAALFMVIAKTLIKNRALTGGYSGPAEVLENVNNQLCEGNDADMFVTAWFGILDIPTGDLDFASAGHEYPAFQRNEVGFVIEKDKHGPPLATFEGIRMTDNHTHLEKGETLYVYTDGITEATNGELELFGEERMLKSLTKHMGDDPKELLENVRKDIDLFVGKAPQFDDMTMLAVRYNGVD